MINLKKKNIITINSNSEYLHPLTCTWINNRTDRGICLTKYDYYDHNFSILKNTKCSNKIDINVYADYLYIPPVGISSDIILKIYNISSSDSLLDFLEENKYNIIICNRILNCWIINNIKILKKHNIILIDIYLKILENYNDSDINKILKMVSFNIYKKLSIFIIDWFNKIDKDQHINKFKLDLLNDFIIYIKKIYYIKYNI